MPSLNSNGFNDAYPDSLNMTPGSPYCSLIRGLGSLIYCDIDINGTGAQVATNCFSFNGPIEMIELWAVMTDASDVTQFDDIYFEVYDGANSVDITAGNPGGVSMTGLSVDSMLAKEDVAANALTAINASQVRYNESTNFRRDFVGGVIVGKTSTTCYIRFMCDTDANTDVTMTVFMAYNCRYPGVTVSCS